MAEAAAVARPVLEAAELAARAKERAAAWESGAPCRTAVARSTPRTAEALAARARAVVAAPHRRRRRAAVAAPTRVVARAAGQPRARARKPPPVRTLAAAPAAQAGPRGARDSPPHCAWSLRRSLSDGGASRRRRNQLRIALGTRPDLSRKGMTNRDADEQLS